MKTLNRFYLTSIFITWTLWAISLFVLHSNNLPLYTQETIFGLFEGGFKNTTHIIATILFTLAVYGPAISAITLLKTPPKFNLSLTLKTGIFLTLFPLVISLLPGLLASIIGGERYSPAFPLLLIIPFFVYQLLTSATEEIGWRGFALLQLLKKEPPMEAGWKLGWVWALWHFPLILYLYSSLHPSLILSSLIGFSFSIVGMSIIYTYLYIQTKSVLIAMIFHALTNTFSIFLLGSTQNPVTGILPAILVWITVFILQKKGLIR